MQNGVFYKEKTKEFRVKFVSKYSNFFLSSASIIEEVSLASPVSRRLLKILAGAWVLIHWERLLVLCVADNSEVITMGCNLMRTKLFWFRQLTFFSRADRLSELECTRVNRTRS